MIHRRRFSTMFPRLLWQVAVFAAVTLLLVLAPSVSNAQDAATAQSDRLGITFISSADHPADEARYRQALLLGAGWNRWPLYWQMVESSAGQNDWSRYDQVVSSDIAHGLKINAILLGIPAMYQEGGSIRNLSAPVFSDGTDIPGAGKTINPNNPWANFVYQAVSRYKPGGAFGQGVSVWEVWNEPDLEMFWTGGVAAYARMLKVAYLAAHHADPNAEVMFGGLAYINPESSDWLASTLAIIAQDPQREANGWYMDKVAVHNYSNAWRSGWVVDRVEATLARYGLSRPVWLNESGVPVWDDYPGPTWAAGAPEQRRWRGTMQQAAAFVVQSTAYAWAAGAEVVFFHQLYDDCGNQAGGTDFAPDSGMWGDAHGLFRNERGATCFSQSPFPGSPRPAAAAFHLMARVFGSVPFSGGTVLDLNDQGVVIAFDRPQTSERIYVLWNNSPERLNLDVPALGERAELFSINNQDWYIEPTENEYTIGLPPRTGDDMQTGDMNAIGGNPFILVEQMPGGLQPLNPALVNLEPFDADAAGMTSGARFGMAPAEQIIPTPGPIIGGGIVPIPTQNARTDTPPTPMLTPTLEPITRPTVDPANDSSAPVPFVLPLPIISPPTFTVSWGARDDNPITNYVVWSREAGGEWQVWLDGTTATQGEFTGESGKTYEFAVWAQDAAGNWSLNTELTAQARTAVQ